MSDRSTASGSELIQQLLEGRYRDPDDGSLLRVATRRVVIADSLAHSEADLVRDLGLEPPYVVVSDAVTFDVLGQRVVRALETLGAVHNIILPGQPKPDMQIVRDLSAEIGNAGSVVAVGSGTINDICKMAATVCSIPYAVFATAPSMNGYVSENAAITVHGHKKSLAANAPVGVFMDLGILAAAPARLIRSGFGDSICRSTAQADWLLSHLLLDTPYRTAPFALLAADEEGLFAESEALLAGDLKAVAGLARTLTLSGFGMAICGNSSPASQGEHLISHYIEMKQPADRPHVYHGEQVGVTTLTMARLQERLCQGDVPQLAATAVSRAAVIEHFGETVGADCWTELTVKRISAEAAARFNDELPGRWPALCQEILAVARPAQQIEDALRRIGAPLSPADISLEADFYRDAVLRAREIRSRFTFLDLAADAMRLEPDELL